MSYIYATAYLTIAASAANHSSIRFLIPRRYPTLSLTLRLPRSSRDHVIHIRRRLLSGENLRPLDTRGWAFQERILSRNTVRFSNREIEWECRSQSTCECGTSYRSTSQYTQFTEENVYSWWHLVIVTHFSFLDLTQEMDILPALSGIASSMKNQTGDDYLARIWKKDLIPGLLWCYEPRTSASLFTLSGAELPSSYRAPSWSWASATAQVAYIFYRTQFELHVEVLGAHASHQQQIPRDV
ncbi:uncharacterized protein BDZ99DRAFT_90173 [Mytilinidion resinicola]|uniref:Heterokaryon incompatibility domain-containing protein n=1 Tax=Mytilinidion resinicola TaxID=574789 RepID=A0A6A6YG56_9PEZI|nr:uncharacterized protein BDZ99DRAFT_90173 [Mytilinidion resinicola]KAF2807025.1 hypothetical protein BDZ99DRAFT_90173 [Mytilinidion resinicola]